MEPKQPTVGDTVHFNSQKGDFVTPEAAMIVAINNKDTKNVNLAVWNSGGTQRLETSVAFGSPEKDKTWSWKT